MSEVNLNAMITLKNEFNCQVGYSDHTLGIEVPIAAVALGATIIEKHFTLDKLMEGPDHRASLDPSELKEMVIAIRNVETALGSGIKEPNNSEKEISKVVLKSIVAKKMILKGELFSEDNLTVKRAKGGISAQKWDLVIGKKACHNYLPDELIEID
ncbi:N,N'-diacetyllegionaminic acid synthase [bioreactor metagenome]|uniref:N,N'-diacetyllegionaminic acid synthase n=1 Tax=bioreactor metagenome TaxID=1076179 RepID=A0A645FAH5_9ZZZZ